MSTFVKPPLTVSILPCQYADVPACARISADAFSTDIHTIVKQLGRKPFDFEAMSRDSSYESLHRKNYIYVKAVDSETGDIVGHAGWGFRGVEEDTIPRIGPIDEKPEQDPANVKTWSQFNEKEDGEGKEEDSIDRLHNLEDADMQYWMGRLMPPGTSCMFFLGCTVAPAHQSRGVGSALIKHGASIADSLGLFTWVHSSDQAWRAYKKFGFEVVGVLDVDLDEFAPSSPKNGGENGDGLWGHYMIRYMKRMPSSTKG